MDIKMYLDASKYFDPKEIKADKLTHIIVGFAHVGVDFRISRYNKHLYAGDKNDIPLPAGLYSNAIPTSVWERLSVVKAAYPHLKLILSVGGPLAEGFSDMALNTVTRRIFADSAAEFLKAYDLDGIDINWQYPTIPLRGRIGTRQADRENFTLLLADIRQAIGKDSQLSYTANVFSWFTEAVDMYEAARYADYIHLMTYNMSSISDTETRHHTNIRASEMDPYPYKGESIEKAVALYGGLGMPLEMLCIGYAAYGIEFKGVSDPAHPELPGLYRKFNAKDSGAWPNGMIPYDILKEYYIDKFGYARFYDGYSRAPYLYSEQEKTFITYDDPKSVEEKVNYCKETGLKGLICNEYAYDTSLSLLQEI